MRASHRVGHGELQHLLAERNQYPERASSIDAEIHRLFNEQVAILVLDLSGFSRLTVSHGIVPFLALIHQMQQGAAPAVVGNGGRVIKAEADNLFAVFPDPAAAIEGALDIFRAFKAMNAVVPEERQLRGGIGIGYGDTLVIDGADLFGAEMNMACKLGEDLANPGDILLTHAAHAALPADRYPTTPVTFQTSGLVLDAHRLE